jgi:hypothetical protein
MSFLNAGLLAAGLAGVAIPILIHLLMRRRRVPVAWGAMRFLQEAYKRTRRRLIVQRWLLLATRCLLLACVAVALARPLLGDSALSASGGRSVYILIDNSIASALSSTPAGSSADADASSFQRHLRDARRLLDTLGEADRVAIVPLARPSSAEPGRVLPPSSNLRGVREALDTLTRSDARADLPEALRAVGEAIERERGGSAPGAGVVVAPTTPTGAAVAGRDVVVLLSDFVQGAADLRGPLPRLPVGTRLVASEPVSPDAAGSNVSISGLSVLREVVLADDDTLAQTATIALRRSGPGLGTASASRVRLAWLGADGSDLAPAGSGTLRWASGQSEARLTLAIAAPPTESNGGSGAASEAASGATTGTTNGAPSGARAGAGPVRVLSASLDADALPADDRWWLPLEARAALRVGIISDDPARGRGAGADEAFTPGQWLALALRPGSRAGIELVDIDTASIDQSRLAGLDCAVLLSPQRLDREGWTRLRRYVDAGGMLMVMPPADATVHTWPDEMREALGTPWRVARAADEFLPAGQGLSPAGPGADINPAAGASSARAQVGDLLAPIRGELEELARPVTIFKALRIVDEQGASGGGGQSGGAGQSEASSAARPPQPAQPDARSSPDVSLGARSSAVIVRSQGDQPIIVASRGERGGTVVLVGVALSSAWTDLPAKPLIVPLVQELVRQGVARSRAASWGVAGDEPGRVALGSEGVELVSASDRALRVPITEAGVAERALRRAGMYRVLDARQGLRALLAVNPDAAGSVCDVPTKAAVGAWLGASLAQGETGLSWLGSTRVAGPGAGLADLLATERRGSPTGPLLLIAALALALVELGLARWASNAPSSGTSAGTPSASASPNAPDESGVARA